VSRIRQIERSGSLSLLELIVPVPVGRLRLLLAPVALLHVNLSFDHPDQATTSVVKPRFKHFPL
jgi:hypothetical protein